MTTADKCFCCQELDALNPKFDEAMIKCITGHSKFRIVCLDIYVLHTALVAIHNARCNAPVKVNPDPPPIPLRGIRGALVGLESPLCGGFAHFVTFVLRNVGH